MFQPVNPRKGALGLLGTKKRLENSTKDPQKFGLIYQAKYQTEIQTHEPSFVPSEDLDSVGNQLIAFYESRLG